MTFSVTSMGAVEIAQIPSSTDDTGLGALHTGRGNLPLERVDIRASIIGLSGRIVVTQEFVNGHDTPIEATYIFPLPDRAAVTGMIMTADGREVRAVLQERAAAREQYDRAIASGQRASITEEDRPDVFSMRVGNILAGERVTVALTLVAPLPYEDGAATFRVPLVVAPRYIPGEPIAGPGVGTGYADDTDAVPDASRITPPVLLPGCPNPVRLSLEVDIDPGRLPLHEVRSSLHTVVVDDHRIRIEPGERLDRDFVLRLAYGAPAEAAAAIATPDPEGDGGTYQLTVLPPTDSGSGPGRDVVLLLDRSGSMGGWKMAAARRAAARIVDSLTPADRLAVITFDHATEFPTGMPEGLAEATDRHRFRAVEHLARADARGGTELLAPLRTGLTLLAGESTREPVLVLVTDGQVGNEDQILHHMTGLLGRTRIHTVGIDRAVNAGFLGRLAAAGAGRCELVESEDRLDEAMEHIQRRVGSPLAVDLSLLADDFTLVDDTRVPGRLPGLYPGVPLVITGRYRGRPAGALTVLGQTRDGTAWSVRAAVQEVTAPALGALWARGQLRQLEDRYVAGDPSVEPHLVDVSIRYGVLCRFTAYVAVDSRVVAEGAQSHRITQPVEPASGWTMLTDAVTDRGVAMTMMAGSAPWQAGAPAPGGFGRAGGVAGMARGRMTKRSAGGSPPRPGRAPAPDGLASAVSADAFAGTSGPASGGTAGQTDTTHPEVRAVGQIVRIEAARLRSLTDLPDHERR